MAWIHGWLGLVAGWILFAMFLTGTASYFRPEITRWMQPELPVNRSTPAHASQSAVDHLWQGGKDDVQWFIYLPDDRTAVTRAFVQPKPEEEGKPAKRRRSPELELDPATGAPIHARETRGGEHFYRFHFQLQLPHPWGRWLAGLCGLFMLGAIVSGVVTHKRIFADFFTLRWNKGQRSWLDAHNVSAVLALPYHAVITYTGLMTLVVMYMPTTIATNYAKPLDFYTEAYGLALETEASGTPAALLPVGPMVRDAERRFGAPASRLVVRHPGDATSTVAVYSHAAASLNSRGPSVTYSGATGRLVEQSLEGGAAVSTAGVMLGLHTAQFAAPALRWILFLLGLTGTAMVGTGLLLWTAARRRPHAAPFFGLRLVERLNIATIAGLPVGMASFLLANRLLPAGMEGRGDAEVATMLYAWGALAVVQLLRPARRAWREGFAVGALLFAAIPVVNALTTSRGLFRSLATGDWLFVSVDLATLAAAALLAFGSWRAGVVKPQKARSRTRELVHA